MLFYNNSCSFISIGSLITHSNDINSCGGLRHIEPIFEAVSFFVQVVILAISLTERSYQLLGTERGFVFGDCGFDLGLPVWFAIEDWLPWLYRVETACGYTPEIAFGITMAEALIVISVAFLLLGISVFIAYLIDFKSPE